MTAPAAIRTGWDALLADGGIVHLRPVRPADRGALVALHADASDRSIYLRYFSLNRSNGERYVRHLLDDAGDRLCLVAELHGRLVGMTSCERLPGTADAEVADEVPEIAELDLNPVICRPDGVVAVDVKVRLAPVQVDADLLADPLLRRLR